MQIDFGPLVIYKYIMESKKKIRITGVGTLEGGGWWCAGAGGREPPLPPRVARLPSRLQCGARLSAVRCRCASICRRRTQRHRRTSRGKEQTHPLSAGHTAESRVRFGNTFSISSTLFRPSILNLWLPLCLHCKDISMRPWRVVSYWEKRTRKGVNLRHEKLSQFVNFVWKGGTI